MVQTCPVEEWSDLSHDQHLNASQWMIAQMAERLLCTRQTRVQIPAPAAYEITL